MGAAFFLSNVEYVTLRLVRRWLVPRAGLEMIARVSPRQYLRPCPSLIAPHSIVDRWEAALTRAGRTLAGLNVVELGPGLSDVTGELLLARGVQTWTGVDPRPQRKRDRSANPSLRRQRQLIALESASVDAIISNSVLEHLDDPAAVFAEAHRILRPDGFMLHVVDYRDHFFKYPYHFLQFSDATWRRWLNPGDLPRWRLSDHLRALQQQGFTFQVLDRERDEKTFSALRPHLASRFNAGDLELSVLGATVFCTP